jgi:hypothetical protein
MLDYSLSLALTRWINYKQEKSTMPSSIVFHNSIRIPWSERLAGEDLAGLTSRDALK